MERLESPPGAPENIDATQKTVAACLLLDSNIQAFSPPANFRSPAILWEENGVKIKYRIQK